MASVIQDDSHLEEQAFCDIVDEMTRSISSVREVVKSLREKKNNTEELDTKDGISLLSLKHHVLLRYLHSLVLVSAHRASGHSLDDRTPPVLPFSSPERGARGSEPGDLVDSMVEGRIVLEKIKVLEGRMRYQIEKLVRVAEETPNTNRNVMDDPLAFRPNPQNLVDNDSGGSDDEQGDRRAYNEQERDGVYRPPKLAPMPYTETSAKDKRARRAPLPSALSSLAHQDPSRPLIESTTGLGAGPSSLASNRAREIQRMTEFEEENFTRLVMKKRDAKRRKKDEEDIALGGSGGIKGRRRGGGLEDEFGDVLRSVGRVGGGGKGVMGDGYEELRRKGRKKDVLERARTRGREEDEEGGDAEQRSRKRSRFEKEAKTIRKRMSAKARKS